MKNLVSILVLAAACILIQKFTPWWTSLIVIGMFTAIMNIPPLRAFLSGLIVLFLIWFGYAFYLDNQNAGLLSAKIGVLFQGLSSIQLLIVTGFLGGIIGGLSALTGSLFRRAFIKE